MWTITTYRKSGRLFILRAMAIYRQLPPSLRSGSSIVPWTDSYLVSTGRTVIMLPCSTDLFLKTFAIDPFGHS